MKVGILLFELISEALGLNPNHLNDLDCAEGLVLLCHYYPPCPQPELTMGVSKHADIDFLTVLLQDNIGGLQVLFENKWIDVSPQPGALVVNIGDLLQACVSFTGFLCFLHTHVFVIVLFFLYRSSVRFLFGTITSISPEPILRKIQVSFTPKNNWRFNY